MSYPFHYEVEEVIDELKKHGIILLEIGGLFMPIKTSMELDELLFNKEPIYDQDALMVYCREQGKTLEELSEAEKQPFIKGFLSFDTNMKEE